MGNASSSHKAESYSLAEIQAGGLLRRLDATFQDVRNRLRDEKDAVTRAQLHRQGCTLSIHILELKVASLFMATREQRKPAAAKWNEDLCGYKASIMETNIQAGGAYDELLCAFERLQPDIEAAAQGQDRPYASLMPQPSFKAPARASARQLLQDTAWRAQATAPLLP